MMEKATLAGGCFWCIESAFHRICGIESLCSGYIGGTLPKPTYEEVCRGGTGHREAVEILFDPQRITFLQILDIFWRHIDPLDTGGQFADQGTQYQTAIFYHDAKQKVLAERSKASIQTLFERPIATEILPTQPFYPAETYHQGYCFKNSEHYQSYQRSHLPHLKKLWEEKQYPKPSSEELKEKLTPLQYKVTQEEGTEPSFNNEYWENEEEGIYVDVVTGKPLFTSIDKFDSKTGWPSFTRSIDPHLIDELGDRKLGTLRIEVRSRHSNAHLGHLFPDGPPPTGLRYCINSAALRFIPKTKLEEEGYGNFLSLFPFQ